MDWDFRAKSTHRNRVYEHAISAAKVDQDVLTRELFTRRQVSIQRMSS